MEVDALEKFNKLKPSTIPMEEFHSGLPDEIDQDAINTATHLHIIRRFLLAKQIFLHS